MSEYPIFDARVSSNLSTPPQIIEAWQTRAHEWERLGVTVNGAQLCAEVVRDLQAMQVGGPETLTLGEAAEASGYHPDSIARLIRKGRLQNAGTTHRPRVLRHELAAATRGRRSPSASATAQAAAAAHALARDAIAGRIGRVAP